MSTNRNNLPIAKSQKANIYPRMANVAFKFSIIFGIIALVILFFYAIGEANTFQRFLDILGVVIVISFASFAAGGIIGFLFGIPHTIQQSTLINNSNSPNTSIPSQDPPSSTSSNAAIPSDTQIKTSQTVTPSPTAISTNSNKQPRSNFTPSTNLEQIADWLTKIIVGVGLIQIHKIIDRFNQLCIALGDTLKHYSLSEQNGSLIVGATIILFSIEGFLIVYLWTYLYLIRIQDSMADEIIDAFNYQINTITTKIEDTDINDKYAIDLTHRQLNLSDNAPDISIDELMQAYSKASKNLVSTIFFMAENHRKQNWEKDETKGRMERTIPIFQALIKLDSNFEFPENYAQLGFAFKDKRVPDYQQAFDNLDKAISGFKDNDRITNKAITYFNRAFCRINLDEEFKKSQPSNENTQKAIIEDLTKAEEESRVKDIISNNEVINNWKQINLNSSTQQKL